MAVLLDDGRFELDRPWWYWIKCRMDNPIRWFGTRSVAGFYWDAWRYGLRPWQQVIGITPEHKRCEDLTPATGAWYARLDLVQVQKNAERAMLVIEENLAQVRNAGQVDAGLVWFLAGARPTTSSPGNWDQLWLQKMGNPDLWMCLPSLFGLRYFSYLFNRDLCSHILSSQQVALAPYRKTTVEQTVADLLAEDPSDYDKFDRLTDRETGYSMPYVGDRTKSMTIYGARQLLVGASPVEVTVSRERYIEEKSPLNVFIRLQILLAIRTVSGPAFRWSWRENKNFDAIEFKNDVEKQYWQEVETAVRQGIPAKFPWVTQDMISAVWRTCHGFADSSLGNYEIAGWGFYGDKEQIGKTEFERFLADKLEPIYRELQMEEWVNTMKNRIFKSQEGKPKQRD